MASNDDPGIETVLGPLGSAAMRVVWARGEATVAEVVHDLAVTDERPHAYTTVMTVMSRLTKRGVLDRRKVGRQFVYRANATEPEVVARLSARAVDQLLSRYGGPAIRHFAERLRELDPEMRHQVLEVAREEGP